MGFFKNLFSKKTENDSEWDRIAEEKDSLDMSDPMVREQYVMSCLDQMHDASAELDRINNEYSLVTSYLTDMEEIEAITGEDKEELDGIARHIHDLRMSHDKYVRTPSSMTEREYNHMDVMYDEVEDAIKKIKEEEIYKGKVKSDLKRIDKERKAYSYRRSEVNRSISNVRGITNIAMISTAVLVVVLFLMQMLLELDVSLGYYIAVLLGAVALTVSYVRYSNYIREKERVDNTINELILLENKVKIRFVNNKNLLDYLYTKFEVSSGAELEDLYNRFVREKADRRSFEKNEAAYEDEVSRLVRRLKNYRIKDPEIWIHQSDAIYDKREMVEIRHNLIGRRQKLRKQMEYNEQIAVEASDEIKDVIKAYPEAGPALMELVNRYENER